MSNLRIVSINDGASARSRADTLVDLINVAVAIADELRVIEARLLRLRCELSALQQGGVPTLSASKD